MNASDLATKMLEWEQAQKVADALRAEIEAQVLALGKTQTVGNVRATFSAGRKSYDYEGAFNARWKSALDRDDKEDLDRLEGALDLFSVTEVDFLGVCKHLEIKDAPFTQGQPSVSLKIVEG